jgi:hypothetical protein
MSEYREIVVVTYVNPGEPSRIVTIAIMTVTDTFRGNTTASREYDPRGGEPIGDVRRTCMLA